MLDHLKLRTFRTILDIAKHTAPRQKLRDELANIIEPERKNDGFDLGPPIASIICPRPEPMLLCSCAFMG